MNEERFVIAEGSTGNTYHGATRIALERERQIEKEGFTKNHDAEHDDGSLLKAAICYMYPYLHEDGYFPWSDEWWKPSEDQVRNLEKAGALIAAEIDRLLNASSEQ